MPLTIFQQLDLIKGNTGNLSINLKTLVHGVAVEAAIKFYDDLKEDIISQDNPAQSYFIKIKNIVDSVIRNDASTIERLFRTIVALIGRDATSNQIANATDEQWEAFVTQKMLSAFEYQSGVLRAEKEAYNAAESKQN